MAERDFWMVWRRDGNAPTYQHETDGSARDEAMRLARANPGMKFYVLHAMESLVVPEPEVVCEKLHDDEVPF